MSNFSNDNPDVVAAGQNRSIDSSDEPILVFQGASHEEIEVVCATLLAAGVPAIINVASNDPVLGTTDRSMDGERMVGIYVAPSNVEAARAIINAPELTEEELAAEAALDTRTIEEAEAEVKRR